MRIWYQSYVDYENGKIYWDRLRAHLRDMPTRTPRSRSKASRRTIPMRIQSSNGAARAK